MARIRSPGYPNSSLSEVIEFARKIHERDRTHPVSREAAVQHMGYSGITGSSDRALSALMHYGLAEKAAKGEIRISDLAVRIMHPHSLSERRVSLREAAFRPELFQELRERYPGEPPSPSTLASYLSRSNFATAAISPASKAYLETCYYLQRERAYESDPQEQEDIAESVPSRPKEEPAAMQMQPAMPVSAPSIVMEMEPNELNLTLRGGFVLIEGRLDLEGLAELEGKISALRTLITPKKSKNFAPDQKSRDDDAYEAAPRN